MKDNTTPARPRWHEQGAMLSWIAWGACIPVTGVMAGMALGNRNSVELLVGFGCAAILGLMWIWAETRARDAYTIGWCAGIKMHEEAVETVLSEVGRQIKAAADGTSGGDA